MYRTATACYTYHAFEKCRKHLDNSLPASYQKNFCRGFDRFLCLHLQIDPQDVLALVREAGNAPQRLDQLLSALLPQDLKVAEWNRELVHKGQTEAGQAFPGRITHKYGDS